MIYIHNKTITGLNVHNQVIQKVYKGNRIVWMRDTHGGELSIVGKPSIFTGIYQSFKARYTGTDDLSYNWYIIGVDRSMIDVIYNHNHKKISICINPNAEINTIYIFLSLKKRDNTYLYASRNQNVTNRPRIESFTIANVKYDLKDSSVFAPFVITPSDYAPLFRVESATISDSSLNLTNISYRGLCIEKVNGMTRETVAELKVSITDNCIIQKENIPDLSNIEIVETVSQASGKYDEIFVTSERRYYEKNNLGQYEPYGVMYNVSKYQLDKETTYNGKLVKDSNSRKEYQWDGSTWKEYDFVYNNNTISLHNENKYDVAIPISFKWGTDYKAELKYIKGKVPNIVPDKPWGVTVEKYLLYSVSYDSELGREVSTSPFLYLLKYRVIPDENPLYSEFLYWCDPVASDSNLCYYEINDHNFGTDRLQPNQHRIDIVTFENNQISWRDSNFEHSDFAGEKVTVTGWFDGMYSVKVQLSNAFDEKFVELIITDDQGVPIHDFTPNVAFDGSKNRACITDNITGNNYFSTDPSKDPSIILIGTGDLIPPISYKYKCAADSIKKTDDGWIELHNAKANVTTFYQNNPTNGFTINGVDAGEGFDMSGRLQIGFLVRDSMVNRINISAMPRKFGLSKVGTIGDPYYCQWACQEFYNRGSYIIGRINWLQYNDGEHPFIPPVAISDNESALTWFYYYINDGERSRFDSVDWNYGKILPYYNRMIFNVDEDSNFDETVIYGNENLTEKIEWS